MNLFWIGLLALGGLAVWAAFRKPDGAEPEQRDYVAYKNLIRTTDFGKLTLLRTLLDEAGIRHYSSQANVVHLGEAQLFVERDRFEHAEALLHDLEHGPETEG